MLAAQGIATGDIDVAVAGGMESMSNAPYLLPRVREGLRMGDGKVVDSMITDGLWCSFENCHMGISGEVVADEVFTSDATSRIATRAESHRQGRRTRRARAGSGTRSCRSAIPQRKGAPIVVDRDESIRAGHDRGGARRAEAGVQEGRTGHRRQRVLASTTAPPRWWSWRPSSRGQLGLTPLARIVGQATSGLRAEDGA